MIFPTGPARLFIRTCPRCPVKMQFTNPGLPGKVKNPGGDRAAGIPERSVPERSVPERSEGNEREGARDEAPPKL